jgi:hypothetical protein
VKLSRQDAKAAKKDNKTIYDKHHKVRWIRLGLAFYDNRNPELMGDSAHKSLIQRYLDWTIVEERLVRYVHISKQYPISFLKDCSNKGPYYCHYLAWRLGTWKDEKLFEFLDDLFANGASLKNWNNKTNLLKSCDFGDFWGFVWELQIAKLLSNRKGVHVEWNNSGPDLKVGIGNEEFFVECYTYRKSFGIEEFIRELFSKISERINVKHTLCIQFGLPSAKSDLDAFLDKLFRPYLDSVFLKTKLKEAESAYPILLPIPSDADNLYVYVEGTDSGNYVPGRVPSSTGDPDAYLRHAIDEALNNKTFSNRLFNHRPNLLAVNYLIDEGFQLALNRQKALGWEIPSATFGNTIDAILLTANGIDRIPSIENSHVQVRAGANHLLAEVIFCS